MRVLIADDDPLSLQVTSFFLNKYGYQVVTADDGHEAYAILLEQEDIHLLISDWYMPCMNGLELCRKLRDDTFPRYVYSILLTGNQQEDSLVEGMDAGADDFMHKPFNEDELRVRIRAGERLVTLKQQLDQRNNTLHEANQRLADVNSSLSDAYETIRKDLEVAATIQQAILPPPARFPPINVQWLFLPSHYLGGDMLGFFPLDDNHFAFYQLDVVGHGTSSALQSFMINKMLSHDMTRDGLVKTPIKQPPYYTLNSPDVVAGKLNQHVLADRGSDFYFTMVFGLVDLNTNELAITQAGHPPPIWQQHQSGAKTVGDGGFPVGILDTATYDTITINISDKDRFFLYSDGIPECRNPDGEFYSEARLLQFLLDNADHKLGQLVDNLGQELRNWKGDDQFQDDITLLVLEWEQS